MAKHHIDPALLLIWAQVARSGNLHAAAEKLFLTQPAVSHRLRQLQQRVSEPLYRRGRYGIVPTSIGRALWRLGEEIEATLSAAENLCDGSEQLLHGTIHIAASQSQAEVVLPKVLRQFHLAHPAINLQISAVNSRQARQMKEGYDILFVEDNLVEPPGTQWIQETLLETEIMLLLPEEHPWAHSKEPLHLSALSDADLIWRESGSGVRDAILQATRELGIYLPFRYEMSGLTALREAVRAGIGLGFVSHYSQRNSPGLALRRLDPPIMQEYSVLYRSASGAATLALLDILRSITTGSPKAIPRPV